MGDFFNRASQVAQNVGHNVVNSAKNVGSSIFNTSPEQRELAGLKVQLEAVSKKLEGYYAQIGKKYVEYIENITVTDEPFAVEDILDLMKAEVELKAELENKISEKEKQFRNAEVERARVKAQEEFDREQAKLESALKMEIITVVEFDEKLAVAQKKLDNFDALRKLEIQYNMQIISKDEYDAKVKDILS